MIQEFFIKQNSTLPYLRMELINDGRYDFRKCMEAIQDADVMFSMENKETGILKISNAPCEVFLIEDSGCEEKYGIQYKWNKRDTKTSGRYKGWFTIKFRGELTSADETFPSGTLIMPIGEDLDIFIR